MCIESIHIWFQGVLDRFKQINPKIMFSVDAVRYNNKIHNHLEKLTHVVQSKSQLMFTLDKIYLFMSP